nr:redox-sensing transcriptional repressor Rex [bacterium]
MAQAVSRQTLQRLPVYLHYLSGLAKDGGYISATTMAEDLGLNQVQVRKDLASVSSSGRPKVGYPIQALMADIEQFLGYHDANTAVIVGAGRLGCALLGYDGFKRYGLDIRAAFDADPTLEGTSVSGKPIFSMEKLGEICKRLQVHIGIITVPAEHAQEVCNLLVQSGVLAIWNFAPVHLNVGPDILVHNENMAASLAMLSQHLAARLGNITTIKGENFDEE